MKRWALFILTLTLVSTLALAQATITSSGQATSQGAAVPPAPMSPPLVATPLMHLGNAPTQSAGTSSAAITNPSATPEPPSAVPIRPEIDLGPETVYVGQTAANVNAANTNNANANGIAAVNGRQAFDRGVHSNAAMSMDDGTHGRSLGDIARENRQRGQTAQARTFTNADLDRVANAGGTSGIATAQNNSAYPENNGVINANGVATSTTAPDNAQAGVATPTTNTPPANGQTAPNVTSPEPYNGNAQPQQKPSAATTPHEMSQAQTPANPADQNAANNQNDGEQKTLPKSGSFLPLMAVVGLGATAAGLMARQ